MNNENTSEITSAFLKELTEIMELYSHDEGAELAKETAFNISLIEEADRIRENS